MHSGATELVEGWRHASTSEPPHLFPGDEFLLDEQCADEVVVHDSFAAFVESDDFDIRHCRELHLGLVPMPFMGDIEQAEAFVLLSNPGLAPVDYFAEAQRPYRDRLLANIRQENARYEYPFLFLDPRFSWHAGFTWWQSKLHDLADGLRKQHGGSYQDALQFLVVRSRDFSITSNPDTRRFPEWAERVEWGRADQFLRFLQAELFPFVDANYRTTEDRTYVSHSGGGAFGSYVLFRAPETFDRYLISSPSVWYDDEVLLEFEEEYAMEHARLPVRVFLSVGGEETTNMINGMEKLAERLRKYQGIDLTTHVFPEHMHYGVWTDAANRGLRVLFQEAVGRADDGGES